MAPFTTDQEKLSHYRKKAVQYARWSGRWRKLLLTRYAPRVADLGDRASVRNLGRLLVALSEPWAPTMNNLDRCAGIDTSNTTTEVLLELFVAGVRKAERSAASSMASSLNIHLRAEQLVRESGGRLSLTGAYRELSRRGHAAQAAKRVPQAMVQKPTIFAWQTRADLA